MPLTCIAMSGAFCACQTYFFVKTHSGPAHRRADWIIHLARGLPSIILDHQFNTLQNALSSSSVNPLSGDEGIRTPDLRRAKAALSQLSYIPGHSRVKWAFQDSNLRPRPYQRRALTN